MCRFGLGNFPIGQGAGEWGRGARDVRKRPGGCGENRSGRWFGANRFGGSSGEGGLTAGGTLVIFGLGERGEVPETVGGGSGAQDVGKRPRGHDRKGYWRWFGGGV